MRDDRHRWKASFDAELPTFKGPDVTLCVVTPPKMTLISGQRKAALAFAGADRVFGWPDIASGAPVALSLRRDRVLILDGAAIEPGWHADSAVAVSNVSGAYGLIEARGPGIMALAVRGTEMSLGNPSASVARLFHHYPVMIYRWQTADTLRFLVSHAHLDGFFDLLSGFAGAPQTDQYT